MGYDITFICKMVQIKSNFSRSIKVPEELTLSFQEKCKDANVSAIFSAKICIIINQYILE